MRLGLAVPYFAFIDNYLPPPPHLFQRHFSSLVVNVYHEL
jgi:hypothetical protein